MTLITLGEGDLVARINDENQQLCSIIYGGHEYMHGGGKPAGEKSAEDLLGWQNSEIVMFPIVGPAHGNQLSVNGKNYPLGQHGIVRHLKPKSTTRTPRQVSFRYDYDGSPVRSEKNGETYSWMPFSLEKAFMLQPDSLLAQFTIHNTSSEPMPYMFGWHPAFRTSGEGVFHNGNSKHSLAEVKQASSSERKALMLSSSNIFYKERGKTVRVSSDCANMMLWSPDAPMFCIEPVTQLQEPTGLRDSSGLRVLQPGQSVYYTAIISFR